jgi:CelD/BcsL family acetyltransferase involved in cellulose biosynthesis
VHAPLEPALRVECRPSAELAVIAGQWRALAARALQPNVFYEPEFALAAAPVFGRDTGALLVWSTTGRLLGFFPCGLERRRNGLLPVLVGWTHPYSPLGLPLVDRDHAERVIAAWLDHMTRDPTGPKLLLLPMLPAEGPFASALHSVLRQRGRPSAAFDSHARALLAPAASRDDYLQRAMPGKRRKELRRLRHRLEDLAPVAHRVATSAADVAAATQEFLRLEASGWKGAARTAAAAHPAASGFLQAAVRDLAAAGKARIDLLLAGETPVAATITLLAGDAAWCWKIAYNESFARYSPGVQVLLELTKSLLANPSINRVDSCAVPGHPMIDPIWRERLTISDLLVGVKPQSRPAFALACGAEAARRRALTAAKAMWRGLRA